MISDVRISGVGKLTGSEYNNCIIVGRVVIDNDVTLKTLRSSGSFKSLGHVYADEIKISGTGKFLGEVKVQNGCFSGAVHFEKKVDVEDFSLTGTLTALDDINGENIVMRIIDSKMKNIYGTNVEIKGKLASIVGLNEVETIEANYIDVQYLKAKVIRGNDVIIGKKTKIDLVEYTNSIKVDSKAKVTKIVKMD